MKTKLVSLLLGCSVLSLMAQAPKDPFKKVEVPAPVTEVKVADAPEDAAISRQLLFQEEVYTLPRLEAHILLTSGLSDDGLREAVIKKVQEKIATLDKLMLIHTRSGQRTKVEQIDEFPYPTDMDPAQIPQTLTLVDAKGLVGLTGLQSVTPNVSNASVPEPEPTKAAPPAQEQKNPPVASNGGIGLVTTSTPANFEVRNLGAMLEIEPMLGEDLTTVDFNIATEATRFLGYQSYGGELQPNFATQKLNTACTGVSGKPVFLGTSSATVKSGVTHGNQQEVVSLAFLTPFVTKLPPSKANGKPIDKSEAQKQQDEINRKRFRFQWELYSLTKSEAVALIDGAPQDPNLYSKLRELVAGQKAKLETVQCIRTKSGQRAKLEEIDEHPFPTELHPPQIPQTLTIADQRILDTLHAEGGAPTRGSIHQLPASNGGFGIITKTTPTTFETRNTGESLEIDPIVEEDGVTINISLAPEKITLLKTIKYQDVDQPIFQTQKLATAVSLRVNVPLLVGTMSPPVNTGAPGGNQEDRIWLAFMTVFDQ
jgi:hypothetical protein